MLDASIFAVVMDLWIPAFAGMTGCGNDGL